MTFFRYPGGKTKLRGSITSHLLAKANSIPNGYQYREPFFGGGSIGINLFEKMPPLNGAWVNDKDIGISCLWDAVIKHPSLLKHRIAEFTPTVDAFFSYREDLLAVSVKPDTADGVVDIGFKKLAVHQMSYSGLGTKAASPIGGVNQSSAYTVDCRWNPSNIAKKIDRISHVMQKYAGDTGCTSVDFSKLITDNETPALLYLDPPYYVKGGALYQNSFDAEDHKRMADLLRSTSHSWVLSYDDCAEVRDLYSWAHIISVDVNYSITSAKNKLTGKRSGLVKPELLIFSEDLWAQNSIHQPMLLFE